LPDEHPGEQKPSAEDQREPEAPLEAESREREAPVEQQSSSQQKEVADEVPGSGPAGEPVRIVTAAERKRINRRELLKLAPVLAVGAFAVTRFQQPLLDHGLRFSDWASGKLFSRHRLAQTFPDRDVVPFGRFPYNFWDVVDPGVDLENWTLTVEGLVQRPGEYQMSQIQALPKVVQNTRHVCVEGWDVIGNFGGARGSDFLRLIGADTSARYLEVTCADGYYESIDVATALHPQTLFCYEMYGKPLDRGHGAPLRLQMPTRLGYKQAKYLNLVRVSNVLRGGMRGYWEDQGYSWYGGL
jgi:DMSO/TMAO reductase YedYZ molybdopterin-dependent catalytic subunit